MKCVKEEKQTIYIVGDERFHSEEEAISAALELVQAETVTRYTALGQTYLSSVNAELAVLQRVVKDGSSFNTIYDAFEEHFAARFGDEAQKFRTAIKEHRDGAVKGYAGHAADWKLWSVLGASEEE